MTILLNNVSADTVSNVLKGDGSAVRIYVSAASFGNGFVYIETRASDNDPWIRVTRDGYPPPALEITFNTAFNFGPLFPEEQLRVGLTGSAGASNVFVRIVG